VYSYIVRRLLLTVPVVVGVSVLIFMIIRLIPGDPAIAIAGVHASKEYVEQIRKGPAPGPESSDPVHSSLSAICIRGEIWATSTLSRRPVAVELQGALSPHRWS
jgi:peptide/nickel transport system permease protein